MGKLDGKVALVTGASRGIGKGISKALAAEGAKVTLAARDQSALEELAAELNAAGREALSIPTDVTDEPQVEQLFQTHQETFGRLDILVSNAGAFDGGLFHKLTTEAWDKVIAVNLRGPFLCGRAAFRLMKEQKGGRILNIGSISAQRPRLGSAPYSTSKFGLWGLTQAMALDGRAWDRRELLASGERPHGARRAESDSNADQEPMMSVEEIAQAALAMVTLPAHVNMLEAIVLPVEQLYLGRG